MAYEIWASKIGFEFDKDVLIKIDREPGNEKEWAFVSEFVESNFPLSADEISHGYSSTSCSVILPEPICADCGEPMSRMSDSEIPQWECENCGILSSYVAFPDEE